MTCFAHSLDLTDLDLSNNLITTWETVLKIVDQLRRLKILWLKCVDFLLCGTNELCR
jgi:hypothetical protein